MNGKSALWFIGIGIATVLCAGVYGIGQQMLRQLANDPQIQISEDTAAYLSTGKPLPSSVFSPIVDIGESLAPYFIIYDDQGTPIAGTGLLDGKTPTLPSGVFAYTKEHDQDRITWQPRRGIRMAIVVTRVKGGLGGYVLAGRSLRETEQRERQILYMALASWGILGVTITLITMLYQEPPKKRSR